MSVPVTAFTATTTSEATNVSLSAATAAGEVTSSQNAGEPALERGGDDRRDRDEDDEREVCGREPQNEAAGAPGRPSARRQLRPLRC